MTTSAPFLADGGEVDRVATISLLFEAPKCNKGEDAATFSLPMTPFPRTPNATPEKHGARALSRPRHDTHKS
jgi:hypothetical protein